MARTALFLLAMVVVGCLASDDPTEKMPGVHDLNLDTFDQVVNGGKAALVEFYAPWCGHCKHLAPEMKKLGEMLEKDPALAARLVVAKVDADAHNPLGERFKVQGFPTIKFFPRGKTPGEDAKTYSGERDSDSMIKYLKRKLDLDNGFARVEALDKIASKAAKASKDAIKKIAAELEAAAAGLEEVAKAHGEAYVKLAKKAAEKGSEYFTAERTRLERMMGSGGVAPSKVQEMLVKSSVIGGFLGEPVPSPPEDADEDEEDGDGGDEGDDDEGNDEEGDDEEEEGEEEDEKDEL